MKFSKEMIRLGLRRLAAGISGDPAAARQTVEQPPLRAELFSADQMEQHGKELAGIHRLSPRRSADKLLLRLDENEGVLLEACRLLCATLAANRRITPAGEWLLDNFYLIEEQIRTARRHLPRRYSSELPRLAQGPSAGLPRVYDIALESVAHGDGRVDPESLDRFIAAYQKSSALKLGELWAIPIMLRLALLENLRRIAARIVNATLDRDLANSWADRMLQIAERDPKSLILVIADMARSMPPMSSPFIAEIARRLQGQSPALAMPLTWITQRLGEEDASIEQRVQAETQSQASNQVTISNCIGSLRFLGAMDWRKFVESLSVVEHKLREDPLGIHAAMDFATRDRYRHAVEKIARRSRLAEIEVARKAIQLAHQNAMISPPGGENRKPAGNESVAGDDRGRHVGYYLIGNGLPLLEQALALPWSARAAAGTMNRRHPLPLYLGGIVLLTVLLAAGMLAWTGGLRGELPAHGGWQGGWLAPAAVLGLLCSSHLAVALVNWLATLLATPTDLPRLDFAAGIPAAFRSLTVVPTLLVNAPGIEALLGALEIRFLANRDRHLHFGLLTDFADADAAAMPDDANLLALVEAGINQLNKKYAPADTLDGAPFFLFHRPRCWNPQERKWMGYERKRGKLAALNGLLRGRVGNDFARIVGSTGILSSVKYVITLDTDTELPRDAARQFVGTMAHPLNHPRFGTPSTDSGRQRVVEGYGILQPRLAVSLSGAHRSRYAALFGSEPGIDPYTRAISDVYQDVFAEGSFIGKGIYDIDAFERALHDRFPENRILSHDLLEGSYARTALLSDVQLFEEYPADYRADIARRHRWIRGDWQIASWVLGRVPTAGRHHEINPLSALNQWKIFDNLRRSLVPFALTLLLLLGWTLSAHPWQWTLAVIGIIAIPSLSATVFDLLRKPPEVLPVQHVLTTLRSAGRHLAIATLNLACLPFEACLNLDAIVRSTWRIVVSRRHLLEWRPSGDTSGQAMGNGILATCRAMWAAPLIAIGAAALLHFAAPGALNLAAPVLLLWLVSPLLMGWLGLPQTRTRLPLDREQTLFLQKLARRTWAFFETHVGADDHWLPPDNFQEHPLPVVAHRTSPTNIGLALLSNLAAADFGYLSGGRLLDRTSRSLATMAQLDRYRGHFYNWYDTRNLQPLAPLYVSSVDSGNLAAHLLTLQAGLLAMPEQPIIAARLFEGLGDALAILDDAAAKLPPALTSSQALGAPLAQLRRDLESAFDARPATLAGAHRWLNKLADEIEDIAGLFARAPASPLLDEANGWAQALAGQCRDAVDDLDHLAPWLALARHAESAGTGIDPALLAAPIPSLHGLAAGSPSLRPAGEGPLQAIDAEGSALAQAITAGRAEAVRRIAEIGRLAGQCGQLAKMDYSFLYDASRHLLAIGYNVADGRQDSSFYDLLASEARLATFVGIAQGQLPQESWFALGRPLTHAAGLPVLLSWSGSMFEYLMPLLVMPTYDNTLLDQTSIAAVAGQIEYGKQQGIAWGISESGYNAFDAALNYQYRAFGVPGLGLKRGLADDLVIAPYASALALMVTPAAACANLQRLAVEGVLGKFGLYEAIDHTPSRLPRGQSSVVIRSFMAHHQGMSLLAFAYHLLDRPMQRRFESDRQFQATRLLLQERIPKVAGYHLATADFPAIRATGNAVETPVSILSSSDTPIPEVHLLSNGRYHVMVTNAGGGYSRWKDQAVTRWREDSTCDNWGSFCYIRDQMSGVFWSTAHQPTQRHADSYEAIFSEGRAEFRRSDLDYEAHTEIVVSPEDDIELRRLHLVNRASKPRSLTITSYAEVVLTSPAADEAHPAFSNLFVQTEIVADHPAILCTRRPRSLSEKTAWMFHLVTAHGAEVGEVSFETDRARFIGRGRTVAAPLAMSHGDALSGTAGSVLDPIVAIRYRITLKPQQTVVIDMVSGIADSREAALGLIGKYQDQRLADRVFDLAASHSWVTLRQLNASEADAQLYRRLAGSVIYANGSMRADSEVISRNRRGQSGLWGYSISGDLPIVLLQVSELANIDLVRQMVQAHAYWRLKGLAADLVIWNEDHAGYRQLLREQIMGLIAAGVDANVVDQRGGIFVRRAEQMSDEDRTLVQAVARIIISDQQGGLVEQINRRSLQQGRARHLNMARFAPTLAHRSEVPPPTPPTSPAPSTPAPAAPYSMADVLFGNGLGAFSADGREYVISTVHARVTPAPWVNVLANAHFGSVISESGSAYTWSENAHEFRLTPWTNDAVSDGSGEAFYLRDEESGHFWSPTPLPSRGARLYITRHGFGYSIFEHAEGGIATTLQVFVDLDAALKYSVLKVRNESGRPRRLSATGYVEWVLGDLRSKTAMHVVTEADRGGAVFARNAYNTEFAERCAFFDVDDAERTCCGDRAEFIGRNGSTRNPAAMSRQRLSNRLGAALDACTALQVGFELAAGQERELVFRLGSAPSLDEARRLVAKPRGSAGIALDKVRLHWQRTLGAVQVETPDAALNLLANGWLVYQTLACRVHARSGFYQSGGAFGFRDQLQDGMALIHADPVGVREHLLRAAAHQFHQGDVQHWWHPPSDRGVRTHCSDDFLWLPLAICRYVQASGDLAVLDEAIGFLDGRALNRDEDSYFDLPGHSEEVASLYEHGVRAILHGLNFGEHGLPLMGGGDWNDGMNLVGAAGKGESVWLGFFLYRVLDDFGALAAARGDAAFAQRCLAEAVQLRSNIERHGWDGEWYRRAYFDDGSPLGSSSNDECQIDAVSQSWAVLSGAAGPARAQSAMASVDRRLVNRDSGLIQLLDPPFDKSALDPGYIKGYVPGVRENGGQYTHSAVWTVMAFAALGDNARAWELFDLINPVNHTRSEAGIAVYKVEPYVVAADVYAQPPHAGRGGWTWYTGSAGWMYRLILESLLGVTRTADRLRLAPCLRTDWPGFKLNYRFGETDYAINVLQLDPATGTVMVTLDDIDQADDSIALRDDRLPHRVEVRVLRRPAG